eukprot:773472_1
MDVLMRETDLVILDRFEWSGAGDNADPIACLSINSDCTFVVSVDTRCRLRVWAVDPTKVLSGCLPEGLYQLMGFTQMQALQVPSRLELIEYDSCLHLTLIGEGEWTEWKWPVKEADFGGEDGEKVRSDSMISVSASDDAQYRSDRRRISLVLGGRHGVKRDAADSPALDLM